MDPAFFTVRTPRARTHQQQLACYAHHVFNGRADSKKRVAHPACMNRHAGCYYYGTVVKNLIVRLGFSNSGQVLNFCM